MYKHILPPNSVKYKTKTQFIQAREYVKEMTELSKRISTVVHHHGHHHHDKNHGQHQTQHQHTSHESYKELSEGSASSSLGSASTGGSGGGSDITAKVPHTIPVECVVWFFFNYSNKLFRIN